MVTITDYKEILKDDGTSFFALIIQGDLEMVKSHRSGRFYATAMKSTMASTFTEEVCMSLVGKQLEGRIQKVECDPYEYTIEETGETIELTHRNEFIPEELKIEKPIPKVETFSENGVLEGAL